MRGWLILFSYVLKSEIQLYNTLCVEDSFRRCTYPARFAIHTCMYVLLHVQMRKWASKIPKIVPCPLLPRWNSGANFVPFIPRYYCQKICVKRWSVSKDVKRSNKEKNAIVCKVQYPHNGNFMNILSSPHNDFEIQNLSSRQQILIEKKLYTPFFLSYITH